MWTVTHEAVFRELRDFCKVQSESGGTAWKRKFFSHYVSALLLVITRFKLVFPDWRGYLISLFSLVWIANQYISIYDRLRLDIKHEHISIDVDKQQAEGKPSVVKRDAA